MSYTMLGPFRIRNLRQPYNTHLQRPRSPTQASVSTPRRASLSDDAVVCIEGDRYDRTIEKHPEAKLRYLDDDRDMITIGSKEELAQRLDEPVPALVRSRPRVPNVPLRPSSNSMHIFEIDPMETTVDVWQQIMSQTEILFQDQNRKLVFGARMVSEKPNEPAEITAPLAKEKRSPLQSSGHDQTTNTLPLDKWNESPDPSLQNAAARNADGDKAWRNHIRDLVFQNSNPPKVRNIADLPAIAPNQADIDQGPAYAAKNDSNFTVGQDKDDAPAFPCGVPVLTEVGRKAAQEMGQRLKSNRRIALVPKESDANLESQSSGNHWASYSTALQTFPIKIKKPRIYSPADQPPNDPSVEPTKTVQSIVSNTPAPKDESKPTGALEQSFFENFKAQLARLSESDTAAILEIEEKEPVTPQESRRNSSRISREDYPLQSRDGDHEETKPLLPSEPDDNAAEPSYTLLEHEPTASYYRKYDEQQLVDELIHRGVAPPSTTYESLMQRLKDRSDEPTNGSGEDAPKQRFSDPVEVTVGKMVMQMVSSVISNLETLNSQIQGQARPSIPQEALRLRGYPDTAHADDMWRDIETLQDTFAEFHVAAGDIMRSFERIHDHDEFPAGSGMLRLQGLSSTRGPLPQIATALQKLVTGLQQTCIPAIGEKNGRLQYHIPRRLATSGYEDTWEVRIASVPQWVTEEHQIREFVKASITEFDAEIRAIRLDSTRSAFFEVRGRRVADQVLRVLSNSLWSGCHLDVSLQRKLYPSVFGLPKHSPNNPSQTTSAPIIDVSASGTVQPSSSRPLSKAHPDILEKRKAIQDRRAAWRREYKARTQSVRFEEPSNDSHTIKEAITQEGPGRDEQVQSADERPQIRSIIYRHVPSPIPARGNTTRGCNLRQDRRPLYRPYSYVAASAPDNRHLNKRKSMPDISGHVRTRSRSRSPHTSHRGAEQQLRPSVSMQFDPKPHLDPAQSRPPMRIRPSENREIPTMNEQPTIGSFPDQGDKFQRACQMMPSFRPKQNQAEYHVQPNPTSTFIPYSDRDPAGYISFQPEQRSLATMFKTTREAKLESPSQKADMKAQQSSLKLPTFEELEAELASQPRFPPLPSMKPLEPVRLHAASSFEQKDFSSLPRTTPGAWPLEVDNIANVTQAINEETIPGHASKKLFVGKIPVELEESWLKSKFEPFGPMRSIVLARDPWTGESKGYCHLEYAELADAVKACNAMSGMLANTSTLHVSYSEPKDSNSEKEGTERRESSGAFSCRMMGRSPLPQVPGLPIRSPEHVPHHQSSDNKDVPELPMNSSGGLKRSATTASRDSKTPAAPQGRRPYSMNFDGSGRVEWDQFMRPQRASRPIRTRTRPGAPTASSGPDLSAPPKPERPASTLFQNFNVPKNWRETSRPVPAQRPVSPFPSHDDATTAKIIKECVTKLQDLGYGATNDGGKERLVVIAQAADGDLEDAIDLIEEERSAWKEQTEA